MVSRAIISAALGATLAQAAITNINIQGVPTPTQTVLSYTAPDNNACAVAVSESPSLTPLNADVDPSLFTGADTDLLREGTVVSGQARVVVIGKRAAELALDGKRHSRALQAFTIHFYRITCGADIVSGRLVTANPPFGDTYNDPVFDRSRPGEYAYATIDWADKTKTYIDPHSGVLVKRMSGPGELVPSVMSGLAFSSSTALGSGWTTGGAQQKIFSGANQAYLYYRAADPNWPGGSIGKTPDYVQITLSGASGAATAVANRTIDVCLTNNGVTCASKVVQQALTNTAANYTVGDTTPILEFWRAALDPPSARDDVRVLNGQVNVGGDGVTVTWQSGDLFSMNWKPGSLLTINATDCAIQSVSNETLITLASAGCISAGAHSYSGRNWGVLIRKSTTSTDAITINSVSWTVGTSGYSLFPASGGYDLCSPVATTGPTGNGHLCVDSGTFGPYLSQNTIFWIGDDGTVNPIGMSNGNNGALSGSGLCTSNTGWAWDRTIPGLYYCLGIAGGAPVVFKVQYTGANAPVTVPLDSHLSPAVTTVLSGDINAMVRTLNPTFSTFACSGWQMIGRSEDNLVLSCTQNGQNTPAWVAVYSIASNSIISATSTYGGSAGAANRWSDAHSVFTAGDTDWLLISAGSVGDLPYQTQIIAGGLSSIYSPCPLTAIDPSVTGQLLCSTVTVSTLIPVNPSSGQSLFDTRLLAGDFFQVMRQSGAAWLGDGETIRILAVNGQTLTLERGVRSYSYSLNNNHSGTLALQAVTGAVHEIWWNYVDDPLGQALTKPYGLTLLEDPQTQDCHQVFAMGVYLAGCLKSTQPGKAGTAVRVGDLPNSVSTVNPFLNPIFFINFDSGFAGANYQIGGNALESHPSRSQYSASLHEKDASLDGRPYAGDQAIATPSTISKLAGTTYLYKLSAAAAGNLAPRLQPLLITSGAHPVVDASPAVLIDTPADNYKGCYAVKANNCQVGSTPGEVYVNLPFAAVPYCFLSRFSATPTLSDLCVTANTNTAQRIIEFAHFQDDNSGALVRRLTDGFSTYKAESVFWNVRATPNAKWVFWPSSGFGGGRSELFMLKKPPLPGLESVNRGNFIPIPVSVGPAAGMPTARARFGYAENGAPSSFYCTQRQVDCTTGTAGGTPFVWSDEPQTEQACAAGCTIHIPAIPGRVLYYSIERGNGSGGWTPGLTQTIAVK